MSPSRDDFRKQLLAAFLAETEEHAEVIVSGLIEMEKAPSIEAMIPVVERVFREVHSLKGAARAVDHTEIGVLCQAAENVLSGLKRKSLAPSSSIFDALHRVVDVVRELVRSGSGGAEVSSLVERLHALEKGEAPAAPSFPKGRQPEASPVSPVSPVPSTGTIPPEVPSAPPPLPSSPPSTPAKEKVEKKEKESVSPPPPPRVQEATLFSETEEKLPRESSGARPTSPPPSEAFSTKESASRESPIKSDTVRIATSKIESLVLQAEEMLSAKLMTEKNASDLREALLLLEQWHKEWIRIAPDVRKIRRRLEVTKEEDPSLSQLALLLEFLDWNRRRIETLEKNLRMLNKQAETNSRILGTMVNGLLDDARKVLMLPFASQTRLFPKVVRDIARDEGKQVEIVIRGEDVEIDKRILEELKDPFIHLLRNCIDHGIEKPEARVRHGKSPEGHIEVTIGYYEGNRVEILVSDDGEGIDLDRVRAVAVKTGLLTEEEAKNLDERRTLALIFESDISTSPIITDVSGRGLGCSIIREKVEKLGGTITVESRRHRGTTFRLLLPVTLATSRGILVRVADRLFMIPTKSVERVLRVSTSSIRHVENMPVLFLHHVGERRSTKRERGFRESSRTQTAAPSSAGSVLPLASSASPTAPGSERMTGHPISLVSLQEVLEIPSPPSTKKAKASELFPVLILTSGEMRAAFRVDAILNEQEILVKAFQPPLVRVRNVAGATILGSGEIVPILHPSDLLISVMRAGQRGRRAAMPTEAKTRKSILIAEDSMTSRTLLKNILETAGYEVVTAVDGKEAMERLNERPFDLLVSDIEMPRMNGFELTSWIRNHDTLKNLPVVLVTSLSSKEDQERGMEVGANAYILKSSFDQGDLLDVIQRFI